MVDQTGIEPVTSSGRLALNWPRRQSPDSFLSCLGCGRERNYGAGRSVEPVRSRALWRIPSHGGHAWAWRHHGRPFENSERNEPTGLGRTTFPPDRLAQMRHRHHQQPLAEPGSGTEVPSRGGQSSSVSRVRRAARRPEPRSFVRSSPRRFLGGAFPSMRFLDPRSRGRTRTRNIYGVAVVRCVRCRGS